MQKGVTYLEGARCKLYNTIVLQYKPVARQVILSTGGWPTQSTCKAINNAAEKYGITGLKARHSYGHVYVAFNGKDYLVESGNLTLTF